MPNDAGKWGFLVLIILIIAPLLFWLISLLIMWIKWIFTQQKKEEYARAILTDFKRPLKGIEKIQYELTNQSLVKIQLLDSNFNSINTLTNKAVELGKYFEEFDTTGLQNGYYFLQLITDNQRITQKIIVNN